MFGIRDDCLTSSASPVRHPRPVKSPCGLNFLGVLNLGWHMSSAKAPRSLRSLAANNLVVEVGQVGPTRKVTVGCLVAVASITGAKAQTPLAPVTVEAPVTRKKPTATK